MVNFLLILLIHTITLVIIRCKEANTEPYICLNMGTGTLSEALHWLEYCNGTGDTYASHGPS